MESSDKAEGLGPQAEGAPGNDTPADGPADGGGSRPGRVTPGGEATWQDPDFEPDDFEYERRFYCRSLPASLREGVSPSLIVQSYFVHSDNYALRVRLQSTTVAVSMSAQTSALETVRRWRNSFTQASVTVKGPADQGTRYEAQRLIDPQVAVELVLRGGILIVKNRYSVWLESDGWNIDVFGGGNHPLIVAEVERSSPVTDLEIPQFCTTEITDEMRFANDFLAANPFGGWAAAYEHELELDGPHFLDGFGTNRHLPHDE